MTGIGRSGDKTRLKRGRIGREVARIKRDRPVDPDRKARKAVKDELKV